MPKIKILCIDDTPDEIIDTSSNKTLKKILQNIYKPLPYTVVFEKDGEKGIEIVKNTTDIGLVLLDVEFQRQKKQGDEIVKELFKIRHDLKVIVLTRKPGTKEIKKDKKVVVVATDKISFGHQKNVVLYLVKKELASSDIQRRLRNLSRAVIEDYDNKNWKIKYSQGTITLFNKNGNSYGISIREDEFIRECVESPNKPVDASKDLHRIHNIINNNVREGTDWNTWGILTKEGCARGQLKLVIGNVINPPHISGSYKDPYVTQSQFEKFMRGFEAFKKDILAKLEGINKVNNN